MVPLYHFHILRALESADRQAVIDLAYRREGENLFLLGSFDRYAEPFRENPTMGFFEGDALVGMGTRFSRFGGLVIHAPTVDIINALTDAFVAKHYPIRAVPAYDRYATATIERLRTHGIVPRDIHYQTMFRLTAERFVDHSSACARRATEDDRDAILMLIRRVDGLDLEPPIDETERGLIFIPYEFVLEREGRIVARACTHGESLHFVQLGGVVTDSLERGKGYGKQITSAVCRHWLAQGKEILLFCRDDNAHALAIYRALGFEAFDRFTVGM